MLSVFMLLCYVLSYVLAVCMSCVCQPRQMWEARKDVMYEKIAADTMMEKESWRCQIWLDLTESKTLRRGDISKFTDKS